MLSLPVPPDEWHPNDPRAPEQSEPREVRALTMWVCAIEQGDPRHAHEHPNYRGLDRVSGAERRELRASVPLAVPIELRVRFDGFLRST